MYTNAHKFGIIKGILVIQVLITGNISFLHRSIISLHKNLNISSGATSINFMLPVYAFLSLKEMVAVDLHFFESPTLHLVNKLKLRKRCVSEDSFSDKSLEKLKTEYITLLMQFMQFSLFCVLYLTGIILKLSVCSLECWFLHCNNNNHNNKQTI